MNDKKPQTRLCETLARAQKHGAVAASFEVEDVQDLLDIAAERDALRARVRTLEGAWQALEADVKKWPHGEDCEPDDGAAGCECVNAPLLERCAAALSGAQPDTAPSLRDAAEAATKRVVAPDEAWARRLAEDGVRAGEVETLGAQPDTALAEREASIVELRRALEAARGVIWHRSTCPAHPPGCGDQPCNCGYDDAEDLAHHALAQPAPQAALRAMLVKAAFMGGSDAEDWPNLGPEGVADRLLKGES